MIYKISDMEVKDLNSILEDVVDDLDKRIEEAVKSAVEHVLNEKDTIFDIRNLLSEICKTQHQILGIMRDQARHRAFRS